MSSAFYTSLRSTAAALIRSKGQELILTYGGTPSYGSGVAVPGASEQKPFGVVLDVPARDIDGTNVLRGDKRVIMESLASAQEPRPEVDTLTISGKPHAIINCKPLSPSDINIIYTLLVRSAG
jgi:hypothetical protein